MTYTDFYEIEALGGTYIVSLATAHRIERAVYRAASTDWLEFRDVFGVQHRVLAVCVYQIRHFNGSTEGPVTPRDVRNLVFREADPSLRSG